MWSRTASVVRQSFIGMHGLSVASSLAVYRSVSTDVCRLFLANLRPVEGLQNDGLQHDW